MTWLLARGGADLVTGAMQEAWEDVHGSQAILDRLQ